MNLCNAESRNENHFFILGHIFSQFEFEKSIFPIISLDPLTPVAKIFSHRMSL